MADDLLNCVVIGASGAIGKAFVRRCLADDRVGVVHAFSRTPIDLRQTNLAQGWIDLADEGSIQAAISSAAAIGPIDRLLIATGILGESGRGPEKSLRDLDEAWLHRYFAINSIGPALAIKHAVQHLPRGRRSVIAAMSARVGSISGNSLGGWYGYRASKAALNMFVRSSALEASRRWPKSVIVALHPGTVASALSRPFLGTVPSNRLIGADESVERLYRLIDRLRPEQSGRFFAYDGEEIPP